MEAQTQSTVTLTQLIFEQWQQTIAEIDDARIDKESAQMLIDRTRRILRADGASAVDEHKFMLLLKNALPALTGGHPICKQFIEMLEIETEFN
jgi:hypothetical protein